MSALGPEWVRRMLRAVAIVVIGVFALVFALVAPVIALVSLCVPAPEA